MRVARPSSRPRQRTQSSYPGLAMNSIALIVSFNPQITRLEDFEGLLEDDFVEYSEDSDDDNDDDVIPRGNSQIERCIEQLRDVLGDDVPRRELVRVTLAADCDPNRALNFYFT